jgi:putative inorganic carbon (hco3(-)) transporter
LNASRVARQAQPAALARRPISACVVGVLLAAVLSHAAHGLPREALATLSEFGKVVLYFLLLLAVLNSPARLVNFLKWLLVFIVMVAALALMQFHGLIDIEALRELREHDHLATTGEWQEVRRLRSTGIFNDPNDLSMVLVLGLAICGAGWTGALGKRLPRAAWLAPIGLCGRALALTHSRGGFLALMAGLMVLLTARLGWRKSLPIAALALPVLLLAFAGRMTRISTEEDTGQDRIQLWSDGLGMFRESPLVGVGYGIYDDRAGLVAHNSYIHCFAELGLLGGAAFLGTLALPLARLRRLGQRDVRIVDPRMRALRPFILAMVAAYAVSMVTLTRCYVVPTYLVLGLAAAYLDLARTERPLPCVRFNGLLARRLVMGSTVFLMFAYVFIRTFVNWE